MMEKIRLSTFDKYNVLLGDVFRVYFGISFSYEII